MNIEQMCRDFLREQRELLAKRDPGALSRRTLADYEYALLTRIIPAFGAMRPKAFKPTHAAQYLYAAKKANRAVRGNREVAALASAFNHGMALGLVEANPCRGVRRNRERPRNRSVSITEVNDLLALAQDQGGAFLMVALIAVTVALTGRRRAEILTLRQEQLMPEGIAMKDAKVAGRTYLVAWSPLLREVMMKASEVRPMCDWVFPTRTGTAYTDSGFKAIWNRLIRAYAQRHGDRFRAHDLRALYVSEMLDRGEAPNTHRNPETMHRVYDRRRVINVTPLA